MIILKAHCQKIFKLFLGFKKTRPEPHMTAKFYDYSYEIRIQVMAETLIRKISLKCFCLSMKGPQIECFDHKITKENLWRLFL